MGHNQSSPRTASSRKSNGRSARKNLTDEFKEGEDSTIPSFTGVLADEPDQSNVFTSCPKCQSANIDYNLEIPIKCGHTKCGHIFIPITEKPTPRELHLPLNLVEGATYLEQPNGAASSSKYKTVNSIPELEDIIIYCEKSTITPDFRVDAEIDYGKIMKHLLMPYLQFRTRIFKEGISFKIGRDQEILFKVFACFPAFGRVSKRTVVNCYNSYDNSQTLHSVAVVPLAKLPSSLNNLSIKEKLSVKGVNLSVDQIFKLDNVHFRVLSCFPSNGLLGPQTQIDICKVKLQTIQYVSIEIRQSDIGRLFPEPCTLTDLEIANKIQDDWIQPYFAGVYRYVEPGTTFRVADLECRIDHCSPDLGGLVKENTHFHVFIKHPSSLSGGDGMLGGMNEGGMNLTNPDEELKFEEPEAPSSAFRSHHQQLLQFQNPFAQRFVFNPDDLIFLQRRMLMNHLFQSTGVGGGHGHESGSRTNAPQNSNSGMNMPAGGQSQQNPAPGGGASRRVVNLDELIDTSLLLSNILLASNSGARGRGLDLNGEGASRTQINSLPERKIDLKFLSEKSLIDEDYTKCMICLIDYEDEDTVRTMPCMHYFHKDCLDTWLVKKKYCPLCKTACDAGLPV